MALSLAALQGLKPPRVFRSMADAQQRLDEQASNAQQLQIGQQSQQMNALKIRDEEGQQAQLAAVQQALMETGGDVEAALPKILQVAPTMAPTYQKFVEDQKSTRINRDLTARAASIQNATLTEGQETPEFTTRAPEATPMAYPGQAGAGPTMGGGMQQTATPLAPVTVPGIPDIGVPAAQKERLNYRQVFNRNAEKTRQEEESKIRIQRAAQQAEKEFNTTNPPQPPKLSLEEQTAISWLQQNPGKTLNDYQNMDSNRRRQMVNINLEKIRELDLENKTESSPGQVVFKTNGRPVGNQLPESAATRLEGLQTAIEQADVVEQALLKLKDSGAISGYIEEKGLYWPVVQRSLTPEQAAAVSETNRLLSAYAQAVSGLAVSEPEIQRLQRSAPSVKLTPEANKVIIGHFRRNAIAKRDNYLDVRGWKLKETTATEAAPAAGGGGMIRVQVNGQEGEIPSDQWEAFKAKNPGAVRQ